jgi:hypothetical protein
MHTDPQVPTRSAAADPRSSAHAWIATFAGALALVCALAGCSKPKVPEHDDPPEPQAAGTATPTDAQATELREAIRQPIDRAEATRKATEDAAQRQREAIDAATGG